MISRLQYADLAQSVEADVSKASKSGFEFQSPHQNNAPVVNANLAQLLDRESRPFRVRVPMGAPKNDMSVAERLGTGLQIHFMRSRNPPLIPQVLFGRENNGDNSRLVMSNADALINSFSG